MTLNGWSLGNIQKMKKNSETSVNFDFVARIRLKRTKYIETATTHGFPKIYSEHRVESCFWIWVVLIGVLISILGTSKLVSKYYSYEIYTSMTRNVQDNLYFPSVTFCEHSAMIRNYYAYCGVRFGSRRINPNLACPSIPWKLPEIKNIIKDKKEWSNGLFHIVTCVSSQHTYGPKRSCVTDKYLKSLSKHNNTCFTWNYRGDFHDTYGHVDIQFRLNKTYRHYQPQMLAVVHDPKITELQLQFPTYLEPARTYKLRIQTIETQRLQHPYPSNCTNGKSSDFFSGRYKRSNCLDSLNYLSMLKACGDAFDYIKRQFPRSLVQKYERNITVRSAWSCMLKYSTRKMNTTSNCPVPCTEIDVSTISTFHKVKPADKTLYHVEIVRDKFDSHNIIQEKPLYTWEQIAGEIGGILGLIIGVSFVSVVELCVYMLLLFIEKVTTFFCVK